jgi:ribosomal protein S18 acetylase RimI-like enzyme
VACNQCTKDAVYKCSVCGQLLCGEHAYFRIVCEKCVRRERIDYTIGKTSQKERESIRKLVIKFWGEDEQLAFDRKFTVTELPGYVAKLKSKTLGFISTADADNAKIIVALGVLPDYQGCGVGKSLITKLQDEAVRENKKMLLVSTSNDDLPALGFYQSLGFQIYEVKPDVIAKKHGKIFNGIGNLPVRDELRLRKKL